MYYTYIYYIYILNILLHKSSEKVNMKIYLNESNISYMNRMHIIKNKYVVINQHINSSLQIFLQDLRISTPHTLSGLQRVRSG